MNESGISRHSPMNLSQQGLHVPLMMTSRSSGVSSGNTSWISAPAFQASMRAPSRVKTVVRPQKRQGWVLK